MTRPMWPMLSKVSWVSQLLSTPTWLADFDVCYSVGVVIAIRDFLALRVCHRRHAPGSVVDVSDHVTVGFRTVQIAPGIVAVLGLVARAAK